MSNVRTGSVAAGDTIIGKVGHNTIFHTDAYQIAVKNGFEGTIEEWLESLNGMPATHEWEGTILKITSASGTSSADLKGEKGETGEAGPPGPKGEKGDTPTLEEIGAAPSGYGYGEAAKWIGSFATPADLTSTLEDVASTIQNLESKQITFSLDSLSGYSLYGTLYKHSSSYLVFEANAYTTEIKIILRCVNGTWQPLEWGNPPMVLGVEYRTTERWQGKVVYTKMVDCGSGVNGTYKRVEHGASATQIIRCDGTETTGDSLPTRNSNKQMNTLYGTKSSIWIYTDYDSTPYKIYAHIWYTKD